MPVDTTAQFVNQSTSDGRRARTELTRRRILESARELILSGRFDPTAEAIATRANITRRTLFRHFADMESLHREIIVDAQEYTRTVMEEPFPERLEGSPDDPSDRMTLMEIVIERRARIYEYLLPLHTSAIYQRYRSSTTEQAIGRGVRRRRKRLKEILSGGTAPDALLFESLDAVLSIHYWISLRQDQQLSVAQATQTLRYAAVRMANTDL